MNERIEVEIIDFNEDTLWEKKYLKLMMREEEMIVNSTVHQNEKLADWIKARDPDAFKWPEIH